MESEIKRKLYNMEVTPPAEVWEKLTVSLDEINADIAIAGKIKNITASPPTDAWQNITQQLSDASDTKAKGFVFYFKRFAAAAFVIGIMITAWIFIKNSKQPETGIASEQIQQKKNIPSDTNTQSAISNPDTQTRVTPGPETTASRPEENHLAQSIPVNKNAIKKNFRYTNLTPDYLNENQVSLNNQKPGEKIFTSTVDDLAIVGDGEHYLTMLNANGRLVKVTPQVALLAPHLQNRSETEDIYEYMFGENEYWRETFNEWRKKLALSPAGSGDVFSSLIELLKSVGSN